jgi:hypothetical protein
MHMQTLTRVINLGANWQENNFQETKRYSIEAANLANALEKILNNPNIKLENLKQTVELTISQAEGGEQLEQLDNSILFSDIMVDV